MKSPQLVQHFTLDVWYVVSTVKWFFHTLYINQNGRCEACDQSVRHFDAACWDNENTVFFCSGGIVFRSGSDDQVSWLRYITTVPSRTIKCSKWARTSLSYSLNVFHPQPSSKLLRHLYEWRNWSIDVQHCCNQLAYYFVPFSCEYLLSFGAKSFVFQFAIQNVNIKIYWAIILPLVLYGCETWSFTLWEERRLRVFENRVLRRVFGHKRDEVTGEWRKLHNEELSDLYCSPNIIPVIKSRWMTWAGYAVRMGERRVVYRDLLGKAEGKRPLGRLKRRWEDNIKMDLQEVRREGIDWTDLGQDRERWRTHINAVMNLMVS